RARRRVHGRRIRGHNATATTPPTRAQPNRSGRPLRCGSRTGLAPADVQRLLGEPMVGSARFGIVPAAGVGSRLSPYRAPKELIQIGYRAEDGRLLPKAAIEHVLTAMRDGGVDQALVVLSPAKAEVFRYLGSGRHLDLDLSYLCQEAPLGMPHALDLG